MNPIVHPLLRDGDLWSLAEPTRRLTLLSDICHRGSE